MLGWLVLLPLFFLRQNRRLQAGLVVLPLLAVTAISAAAQRVPLLGRMIEPIAATPVGLAFALAVLWLVAPAFARGRPAPAFLRALVVMAVAGVVFFVASGETDGAIGRFVTHLVGSASILGGMAVAGRLCRTRFSAGRFSTYALAFTALACAALSALTALAAIIAAAGLAGGWAVVAIAAVSAALFAGMLGSLLAALLACYLLVTFKAPLFRARFHEVFRRIPRCAGLSRDDSSQNSSTPA